MDSNELFKFAVSTLNTFAVNGEPVYRCAYCSTVVRSDMPDGVECFPYCSDECGTKASAENDADGVA